MRSIIIMILLASTLSACEWLGMDSLWQPSAEPVPVPPAHSAGSGSLNISSETVNVSLNSAHAADDLVSWINQEQPASADLACMESDPACLKARQVLEQFGVPYLHGNAAAGAVTLYYQHVAMCACAGDAQGSQCTAPVSTVKRN